MKLSLILSALGEAENLRVLLPELRAEIAQAGIDPVEILVVTTAADTKTQAAARALGCRSVVQSSAGYGEAIVQALREAAGEFIVTMDADLSHAPHAIPQLWARRHDADIVVASRYVPGASVQMPWTRYFLSRVLNKVFSRGLAFGVNDMSSGFRLYRATSLPRLEDLPKGFDILQAILARAYAEGQTVLEVPFTYRPRPHGQSNARVMRFGVAYARTFWSLWKLRNSILCADYDARAHDSVVPLQRYWQRMRHKHVVEFIDGEGAVADIGCGSSRIIGTLPAGSVGVDILFRKLRYARRYGVPLIQVPAFRCPFGMNPFRASCVPQVIEHVPEESPILGELVRILKPGGRLVLGTPDYANWQWVVTEKLYGWFAPGAYADEHIAHYTRAELIRHFEGIGFAHEGNRYILQGELILAFRKWR